MRKPSDLGKQASIPMDFPMIEAYIDAAIDSAAPEGSAWSFGDRVVVYRDDIGTPSNEAWEYAVAAYGKHWAVATDSSARDGDWMVLTPPGAE